MFALVACAPRGALTILPSYEADQVQRVFVATSRAATEGSVTFGPDRSTRLLFGRIDLSIPKDRVAGELRWPRGEVDFDRDFVGVGASRISDPASFRQLIREADTEGQQETLVYVHGFNKNLAESVYRIGQVAWDFEAARPVVAFSWPSAAETTGYVYDRDSIIFARDDLERLLIELTKDGRKVFLMGHSMGSQLIMEVMRQISIGGTMDLRQISGVALFQPDIDEEVFERQASRIDPLPEPFAIFVAAQDRALRISAWLTGREKRLGSIQNPEQLGDLPVVVIDLTQLGESGGLNHSIAFNSPTAIRILKEFFKTETNAEDQAVRRIVLTPNQF